MIIVLGLWDRERSRYLNCDHTQPLKTYLVLSINDRGKKRNKGHRKTAQAFLCVQLTREKKQTLKYLETKNTKLTRFSGFQQQMGLYKKDK